MQDKIRVRNRSKKTEEEGKRRREETKVVWGKWARWDALDLRVKAP